MANKATAVISDDPAACYCPRLGDVSRGDAHLRVPHAYRRLCTEHITLEAYNRRILTDDVTIRAYHPFDGSYFIYCIACHNFSAAVPHHSPLRTYDGVPIDDAYTYAGNTISLNTEVILSVCNEHDPATVDMPPRYDDRTVSWCTMMLYGSQFPYYVAKSPRSVRESMRTALIEDLHRNDIDPRGYRFYSLEVTKGGSHTIHVGAETRAYAVGHDIMKAIHNTSWCEGYLTGYLQGKYTLRDLFPRYSKRR